MRCVSELVARGRGRYVYDVHVILIGLGRPRYVAYMSAYNRRTASSKLRIQLGMSTEAAY